MIAIRPVGQVVQDRGIKILVHGLAGAGKTVLCTTAPPDEPTLLISAEAGLLSIRHADVQVAEVSTLVDIQEIYTLLRGSTAFRWVCLDSISEIAEVVLANEKQIARDPRQAYGALIDHMAELIRAFRDLPGYNVVMTAKTERAKDAVSNVTLFLPMLPGQRLGQLIPYWFDEVLALRVETGQDGTLSRWLQTGRDLQYDAKDRSGTLALFEPPNLAHIAAKIRGTADTAGTPSTTNHQPT